MITTSTHTTLRLSQTEAEALMRLLRTAEAYDFAMFSRDHHKRALVRVLKRLEGNDGRNYSERA